MSTFLKQDQPTFGSLAGNGRTFEVPAFQRDYSWDKEEWEDLWLDLTSLEPDGDHYMGYVVLQETRESKNFIVIDGQQRLTTISILITAAVKIIEEQGDQERADLIRNTYLSYKEASSLIYKTKLKLNRNNDYVYSSQILQLKIPQYTARLKPSEKRMIAAFRYFETALKQLFSSNNTADIAAFITKKVDEKLFFTSITVGDDVDAYKVFETLNARGVKLSTADLLKNFLFSKVYATSQGDVDAIEKKWYRINDLLGRIDLTNYIRHFWNARYYPPERKSTLFKAIKKKVNSYKTAIEMIDALDDSALIYASFSNPDSEIWINEQSRWIQEINILEVSQCYSLLLSGKQFFTDDEFSKLLRDIVAISFRYNTIGGLNPNDLERVYGKASVSIFTGEVKSARDLFNKHLKDVYRNDNDFKNDFRSKQLNTNKHNQLVKYILAKLEVQMGGADFTLSNKNITIEHILPENPTNEWASNFDNAELEDYIFRIGNLTLLEASKNKSADRKDFIEKLAYYSSSNFALTKNLKEYSIWNVSSIASRQSDLANKAATVWKINY